MWKSFKLIDIVNIDIGKTPSRNNPKYWDKNKKSSNVWVSIRDMSKVKSLYIDDSNEYISDEGAKLFKEVPKNTLIMSFKLSIGKLAITKINLRTNEAIAAFKIKDETLVSNKYLYYFLSSMNWDRLAGYDIKVKGKTLNKAKLKEILITLPPLIEQQRIVAKLDAAFAEIDEGIKVANNKETKIDNLKISVLKFVFKNNWELVRIGDILKTGAGGTPLKARKEYYEEGKISWLQSGAVCKKEITSSKTFITQKGLDNSSAKLFPKNTVLVAMYGATAAQAGILRFESATNQAICGIYPSNKYLPEFLFYFITHMKKELLMQTSGVAQPNLSQIKIKNIKIPVINIDEQEKVLAKIDLAINNIILVQKNTNMQLENFKALKSAILKKELQKETV